MISCFAEVLMPFFFFLGTKFNITSLISLPMDMSEVILNFVPRKKKGGSKNLCSARDQVAKLFSAILVTRVWRGGST
jgi:hypothetical protein